MNSSDRNLKENFKAIDSRELLEKVANLPISSWSCKSEALSVKHVGPTAQDFHSAFGLGQDDKHIASIDEGGVALAAIQGVYELAKEREIQIEKLQKQVSELRAELADQRDRTEQWEARLASIERALGRSKSLSTLTVSNISEDR